DDGIGGIVDGGIDVVVVSGVGGGGDGVLGCGGDDVGGGGKRAPDVGAYLAHEIARSSSARRVDHGRQRLEALREIRLRQRPKERRQLNPKVAVDEIIRAAPRQFV